MPRIAVAYKWAGDAQEATVADDGAVDFGRAKPVVSDYDAVAIAVGRRIADAMGAELVGISIGGPAVGTPMASKAALARGLDSVMVVADDALSAAGTTATASVLAAMVRQLGDVVLVLAGDSSIDVGAKMVAPVLGGMLGWPTLTDVVGLEPQGDGFAVSRVLGSAKQELVLPTPAVVAVATDAARTRAPGMKDVLAAAKKPVTAETLSGLGNPDLREGSVRSTGTLDGPTRRGIRIDGSDPQAAARQLVAALREEGLLAGAGGGDR